MSEQIYTVLFAGAVRDAEGVNHRPGAVMVDDCGKVVIVGPPEAMPELVIPRQETVNLPNKLLLPAMVNAHTHLELTDIGPQPYDPAGGFVGWVKMLRSYEPEMSGRWVESAKRGAAMCHAAGVQAVGDIARSEAVAEVRHQSGLSGMSFRELFGLGPPFDRPALQTINEIQDSNRALATSQDQWDTRQGLQPHAPYSAGHAIYADASWYGPRSTHLAETQEEADFVSELKGPLFDYVCELGRWDDTFAKWYGRGLSPVQWMQMYLEAASDRGMPGWLVAHCNYVSDEDIQILADTNTSVAYCPIASEYFGHTGHRYRDMLAAGVNVCLGTDSIVGTDPNDPQPLGLLSAMRRLYSRDGTDPATLLQMATVNGSRALRLDGRMATLQMGVTACIEFDPANPEDALEQVLKNNKPVEYIDLN